MPNGIRRKGLSGVSCIVEEKIRKGIDPTGTNNIITSRACVSDRDLAQAARMMPNVFITASYYLDLQLHG